MRAPILSYVASTPDFDDLFTELVAAAQAGGATVRVEGPSSFAAARPLPWSPATGAAAALALVARWSEETPDIVHAADLEALPWVVRAASFCGVPQVVGTLDRSFEALAPAGTGVGARLARRALHARLAPAARSAARAVCLHAGARASWHALGVRRDRTVLLDSGFGLPFEPWFGSGAPERPATAGRDAPPAPLRVGLVPGAATRAAAEIEAAMRSAGLDGRLVPLPAASADRRATLAAVDVALSLETSVGQAVALQEAMASWLPVVATRVPGHLEIVRHGDTGVLVDRADPVAAVKALSALRSPAVRAEAGARARAFAARLFDRDLAVRKVLTAYDALLGAQPAGPARVTASGQVVGARELV